MCDRVPINYESRLALLELAHPRKHLQVMFGTQVYVIAAGVPRVERMKPISSYHKDINKVV